MTFDSLEDTHQRIAYDLEFTYFIRLTAVLEHGYTLIRIAKDIKEAKKLANYYTKLPAVLNTKRMQLKLDCMKQQAKQTEVQTQTSKQYLEL